MYIDSIIASILGLGTVILTMVPLFYPYWFQQTYRSGGSELKKGFGLWSTQSYSDITTEIGFLATNENVKYSDLCENDFVSPTGSWVKTESEFQGALCQGAMKAVQIFFSLGVTFAFIAWLGTMAAVFYKAPGRAEKVVSGATSVGSIVITVALMVWAIKIQIDLQYIPVINSELQSCKAGSGEEDWSCWFYGTSYWIALGSTVAFALTGCFSSRARRAKEMHFRTLDLQVEARDIQFALAESMEVEKHRGVEKTTASEGEQVQVQHPAVSDSDHYEGLTDMKN